MSPAAARTRKASKNGRGQDTLGAHETRAPAAPLDGGHAPNDAQSPFASVNGFDGAHGCLDTQSSSGAVEDFKLRPFVRELVEEMDAPDLDALAALILERLPEAARERVILRAVKDLARRLVTETRRPGHGMRTEAPGSARWDEVKRQNMNGALKIYRWWISFDDPNRPAKFFEDCTRADVAEIAADRTKAAVANADQAQRFKLVLKEMAKRNVQTVGELPVEPLVEIFDA